MTDHFNGEPNLTDPATVTDVPIFPVNVPCGTTADAGVGSTCAITTSGDAIVGSNGFPGTSARSSSSARSTSSTAAMTATPPPTRLRRSS
jgi:hypothetical protein